MAGLLAAIAACGDDATPTPTSAAPEPTPTAMSPDPTATPTAMTPGFTPLPPTPTPTATPIPQWRIDMERITAAAIQEGNLVTKGFGSQHDAIGVLFSEAFPGITVETNLIRTSEAIARLDTERGNNLFLWDIFMGGMSTALEVLEPRGWTGDLNAQVIVPDARNDIFWIGGWEAGFADLVTKTDMYAHQETAGGGGGGFMYVNRDCVSEEEFSTIDDILKVDSSGDPLYPWSVITRRGSLGSFTTFLYIMKGEEFIRELFTVNPPLLDGDGRRLVEEALSCEFPLGDIGTDSVQPFHDLGVGLNLVPIQVVSGQPRPEFTVFTHCCGTGVGGTDIDGFTTTGGGGVFMITPAKNPNAAQLYINWFLQRDAQTLMADFVVPEGNCSRRLDLPNNCAVDSPVMLQPNGTYVNGSNTANGHFEIEITDLVNEILGR